MKISVVLSTYQNPEYLKKVLYGYVHQSFQDFDVVIADDGSCDDTKAVIEEFREKADFPIQHVWQPDDGFRKSAILNKAIVKSGGDYIVLSDGDCIPRSDFLEAHAAATSPGTYLSGGVEYLTEQLSRDISQDDICEGRAFDPHWLAKRGVRISPFSKTVATGMLRWLLNRLTTTRRSFNGHNSSAWKRDILAVNGFDERMGYGGLDRELGQRLINSGVRGKGVRYSAICIHLHHERPYANSATLARNDIIRKATQKQRLVSSPFGIEKTSRASASAEQPH